MDFDIVDFLIGAVVVLVMLQLVEAAFAYM